VLIKCSMIVICVPLTLQYQQSTSSNKVLDSSSHICPN
jgi:hypothetical protein